MTKRGKKDQVGDDDHWTTRMHIQSQARKELRKRVARTIKTTQMAHVVTFGTLAGPRTMPGADRAGPTIVTSWSARAPLQRLFLGRPLSGNPRMCIDAFVNPASVEPLLNNLRAVRIIRTEVAIEVLGVMRDVIENNGKERP